jgi:hypothetical protein
MRYLPYLSPWIRVLFLTGDEMTGRLVQPFLRRALEMRQQVARGRLVELDARRQRLRAARAAVLV